jgi:hypothetical protein
MPSEEGAIIGERDLKHWLADVLRWSPAKRPEASQVIAAMLGLAVPILVGVATDQVSLGAAAAIGGLALGGVAQGRETFLLQASALTAALLTGCAAILTGTFIVHQGSLILVAIPAIAALAALVGGISRPMAQQSTRFARFMIIAANLSTPEIRPLGMMLLFFLGATWTLILSLLLWAVFGRAKRGARDSSAVIEDRRPPTAFLLRRWLRSLSTLSGWQYLLRSASCLMIAEAVAWVWPGQHGQWIALTVAIVLDRRPTVPPTRLVERALGTVFGVVFASLLLVWTPPRLFLTIPIAALAAARPILRAGNYTTYAMIMTPLVVLLLDFDQTPSAAVLLDRLMATIVGCLIAFLFGYLPWVKLLAPPLGSADRIVVD